MAKVSDTQQVVNESSNCSCRQKMKEYKYSAIHQSKAKNHIVNSNTSRSGLLETKTADFAEKP